MVRVVTSCSRPDPSEAWVYDLSQVTLRPVVPLSFRKLFEAARGALAYSLMFYPLLALGAEQLFRVLEASASLKCKETTAPSKNSKTLENQIDWLAQSGLITAEQKVLWHNVRQLRNRSSHPRDENIYNPGMAVQVLHATVELINALFPVK